MEQNQYSPNTYSNPQAPLPANANPAPMQSVVTKPPGSRFPKLAIFAILAIVLVGLIFVVFKILTSSGTKRPSGNLTWWGLWEEKNVVQPLIDEYESSHNGVKIDYIKQSPQDYRERLTNALAQGTGPDIFTFHNTWVPMFRNNMDSLPASIMNPADFAKTFYPIASSDLISGSSIVGIPLEYDGLALYINQDIFNKSGKAAPTTWDEFRSTARSLTVKDSQGVITQAGAALGRTENVDHWPEILALLMLQNGVDLNNPVGKTAEDAITYFTLFSTTDGIWDASLPPSTQAFAAGKLAMYIGPSWRAFDILQQNPTLNFKAYSMPQLPKDNPTQPDITYATYWSQGVWSGSSNKSTAWDFLKFLSTQSELTKFYQNASKIRSFGEPYPRVDMSGLLIDHPLAGSVISQAPGAVSWYLASRTFDGPTGINTLMAKYFEDAVNSMQSGNARTEEILSTLASGVSQVLAQYKLIAR